ncbi:MAG: tyrosine-type recombinase/integrase [Nanoarchaeota archaeon]|nr:tyrosine-type recombinase/integrase [Nanoarchaeota archaeon]
MKKICIHDFERQYELYLRRFKQLKISKSNIETVFRFKDACLLNGISKARIVRYLRFFIFLFDFFKKDLDKATKEDIEKVVAVINARESFSLMTKHDCKVIIKRFYKWLKGNDEVYPSEVSWIKSRIKRHEKKLVGDGELITPDEVKRLLDASDCPRDKAFVSLLYESGCRIGELGSMTIGSINFDKYGAVIAVSGKTGSRKIRIVTSTPYLRMWLNMHPFKDEKDKPLWINLGVRNRYNAMAYDVFRMVLARLFQKAGINKRHNAHLFRHSRATYMANYLTEFQMNQYFGWIQGSDMPATYVHLSGRETDKAILEMNGLKNKKEEKEEPNVKACPRCEAINDFNDVSCGKCSFVLDEKEAIKIETKNRENERMVEMAKEILSGLAAQFPEAREIMVEKMRNFKC